MRSDADDFGQTGPSNELQGDLFSESEPVGPFAKSRIEPKVMERRIGDAIWARRGRANAITLATLMRMFGYSDRTVKGVVEQLVVTHKMRIGAVRAGDTTGYYMIETAEDLEAAVQPFRNQITAMWRRLRVLVEPHALRELHGQLTLGDDEVTSGASTN